MIHIMEGQHHSLLITLCSLSTKFNHSIVALCNFPPRHAPPIDAYWFSSREAEYCTPSLNLGPPSPFILWQTLCSTDLPPLPVQVPKTMIQNENNPYPTSITLNPSADESFKHLTRAAHYVLFKTNFCFWQCMERIKIARRVAGKNKLN